MPLIVYTARQYDAPDVVDITPGTGDVLGRVLGLPPSEQRRLAAPWSNHLAGKARPHETAGLAAALVCTLLVAARPGGSLNLLLAAMARLAPEVTLVCRCEAHGRGACLRVPTASALCSALGDDGRFGGERAGQPLLVTAPGGRWEDVPAACRGGGFKRALDIAFGTPEVAPAPPPAPPLPSFAATLGISRWPLTAAELRAARSAAARSVHPDVAGDAADAVALARVIAAANLAEACALYGLVRWPCTLAEISSAAGRIQAAIQFEGLAADDSRFLDYQKKYEIIAAAAKAEGLR